jgi:cytochrome c oxidase subunit 2
MHVRWHFAIVLAVWALLTLIGYLVVALVDPFPVAASEEAEVVDEAFTLLTYMAVPVFTFVVSIVLYSCFRFRLRASEPDGDGPNIRFFAPVVFGWFAITTGLTIAMIIHPGISGWNDIKDRSDEPVDLVVELNSVRFAWFVNYTKQGVTVFDELVLPLDAHVHFRVTSQDVLHSFWVPAFRVKIDAVPGSFTSVNATPNELGTFEEDANFRVQCAELCGPGHSGMSIPVRVVTQAEFDDWIGKQTTVGLAR